MPVRILDRTHLISDYLDESFSRERIKRAIRGSSEKFQSSLLKELRDRSPDGSKWNDPNNVFQNRQRFLAESSPRPSLRKFGVTIKEGWIKPRIDFIGSTKTTVRSSINFLNRAPHIQWNIDGVDKTYTIPGSVLEYRLYFFWNKQGRIVAPKEITHKGFRANPFVDNIMRESERARNEFTQDYVERLING